MRENKKIPPKAFIFISLIIAIVFVITPIDFICAEKIQNRGLNVFIVRHAETVGNATGVYTEENEKVITEKGYRQIDFLTEFLSEYKFDAVIVSPKIRAINTILPYLKKTNTIAEIWPEVAESHYFFTKQKGDRRLMRGSRIILDSKARPFFKFNSRQDGYFYKDTGYNNALARIVKACNRIKERFGQSGKTVLIVAHSGSSAILIDVLENKEPIGRHFLANTNLAYMKQSPEDEFRLVRFSISPERELAANLQSAPVPVN